MKIGSLFSGIGGLDLAVEEFFNAETVWHCEYDKEPSKVLAARWPGVPNLGDVTKVDWSEVEHVDWLVGGFPCQDVSLAGLRRGLKQGTRSGLWSEFARAIDQLRPSYVLIENVRGLLSAEADRNMESDPWGLGEPDGGRGLVLRALGAVLGDLADLGYDAEWTSVRAADAGAPHGRFRVFIVAYPADPRDDRLLGLSTGHDDDDRADASGHVADGRALADPADDARGRDAGTRGARRWQGEAGAATADSASGGRDWRSSVTVGGPIERTPLAGDRGDATPHTDDLGINGGGATW